MQGMVTLVVGLLVILAPSGGSAQNGDVSSFLDERRGNCVEIEGEDLDALEKKPLENLELLVARGTGLVPIPFQVDERVEIAEDRYAWVLPQGPEGGSVVDDGLLDDNDQLVFMAKDLGIRAGQVLQEQLGKPSLEIQVTDPLNGAVGFA